MKVKIIQPFFSEQFEDADEIFQWELNALDECDDSLDLIILPEGSDAPVRQGSRERHFELVERFNERLIQKARETAKRCHAMVFFNANYKTETGDRNTTYALNREGEIVGLYFKHHLVRSETTSTKLDSNYTYEFAEPYILELEGIRFAFLTCYDFYFYEAFPTLARENVDIIIGCSHQRSDPHSALEIINRFLCYNTNAYLIRSSVSMGEEKTIGGCSMVVAPNGDILANLESRIGTATVEIDPKKKFYKPAGYGSPVSAHYEYIEAGRRPWMYRPSGSAIVNYDEWMEYPRVCAHRGFSVAAPENSMPAFGSAVALGAEEFEFDIWFTKDGVPVSVHDLSMERLSDGNGIVTQMTYDELLKYDFGAHHAEHYKGLKVVKVEDIFRKFAGQAIMNVHLKTPDDWSEVCPYDDEKLLQIINLIHKYDCERHAYIMCSSNPAIRRIKELAPQIRICCGAGEFPMEIVDRAIALGCEKVQLFKPYFNQEMIDKAHAHGIICNVFFADEVDEAIRYLEMGIDTILTNNYLTVANAVKEWKAQNKK